MTSSAPTPLSESDRAKLLDIIRRVRNSCYEGELGLRYAAGQADEDELAEIEQGTATAWIPDDSGFSP